MSINIPYKISNAANPAYVMDCRTAPDHAIVYTYHGGPNQVFYFEYDGSGFLIRAKHNGTVLEVPPFSDGSDGTILYFARKNGSPNQRFTILNNNSGGVSITAYNGKHIGPKGDQLTNLNQIVLQTAPSKANTWILNNI